MNVLIHPTDVTETLHSVSIQLDPTDAIVNQGTEERIGLLVRVRICFLSYVLFLCYSAKC